MLATSPTSAADRTASMAPAPVRAVQPAPQTGLSFAQVMQNGQATHGVLARPAEQPASHAESQSGASADGARDDESQAKAQRVATGATAQAGAKPAARAREKASHAMPATPASPSASAPEKAATESTGLPGGEEVATGTVPSSAVPGAALRDWLAALKLPPQAGTGAAAEGLAALASHATGNTGRAGAVPDTDTTRPPLVANADDAARNEDSGTVAVPDHSHRAGPALEPADLKSAERRPALPETPAPRDAVQGLLSGASGAVPRGFDAGTLAPIALPAPLHSPEFSQALGAQVSLLAHDGVQQAELHLNPADMGPINVQIEINGKEARVDFSASAAATREVIERGLPELASALREQGLTLAGGGVFQQAPDPRDKPGREAASSVDRSNRRMSAVAAATPRAIAMPVPQGRLDLYA